MPINPILPHISAACAFLLIIILPKQKSHIVTDRQKSAKFTFTSDLDLPDKVVKAAAAANAEDIK